MPGLAYAVQRNDREKRKCTGRAACSGTSELSPLLMNMNTEQTVEVGMTSNRDTEGRGQDSRKCSHGWKDESRANEGASSRGQLHVQCSDSSTKQETDTQRQAADTERVRWRKTGRRHLHGSVILARSLPTKYHDETR